MKIVAIHSRQTTALQQLSKIWKDTLDASAPVTSGAVTITTLFSNQASREGNPDFSAKVSDPSVFLINGLAHGDTDAFTGYNGETLYRIPVSFTVRQEISKKVVHLLSCSTAEVLGPQLVAAGCRGFFGYAGVLDIDNDSGWQQRFIQCDAQIDIALASGQSAPEALQAAQQSFIKNNLSIYVSQLKYFSPKDSITPAATMPGPKPNALATNTIPTRSLPSPNSITSRPIGITHSPL
jgi:hypothetical protein